MLFKIINYFHGIKKNIKNMKKNVDVGVFLCLKIRNKKKTLK